MKGKLNAVGLNKLLCESRPKCAYLNAPRLETTEAAHDLIRWRVHVFHHHFVRSNTSNIVERKNRLTKIARLYSIHC